MAVRCVTSVLYLAVNIAARTSITKLKSGARDSGYDREDILCDMVWTNSKCSRERGLNVDSNRPHILQIESKIHACCISFTILTVQRSVQIEMSPFEFPFRIFYTLSCSLRHDLTLVAQKFLLMKIWTALNDVHIFTIAWKFRPCQAVCTVFKFQTYLQIKITTDEKMKLPESPRPLFFI